jgi:hypothetical protein
MAQQGEEVEVTLDNGRVITVTADNEAECRSCGAPILWCITRSGKKMPCDLMDEDETSTTSHFATCPNAGHWRKST